MSSAGGVLLGATPAMAIDQQDSQPLALAIDALGWLARPWRSVQCSANAMRLWLRMCCLMCCLSLTDRRTIHLACLIAARSTAPRCACLHSAPLAG